LLCQAFQRVLTLKITLDKQGSYLGMEKGCFVVKDKQGDTKRYHCLKRKYQKLLYVEVAVFQQAH